MNIAKEIAKFCDKCVLEIKGKTTTTTQQKIKHKNPCQSRDFAPNADALPLHHRVNWEYRLYKLLAVITSLQTPKHPAAVTSPDQYSNHCHRERSRYFIYIYSI